MTKISNQIVYIPDIEINGLDYFIGTDYDQNKRTVNFRVEDLGGHYNMTNGIRNFEYIFYEHTNISPTPTDGYFYSNDNETDPNNIDYFIFSKKTARDKDVTQFFQSIISDNPFDLIVAQKTGINTIFFFRINEIIENANYFRLNVSEVFFPENNSLGYTFSHAVFNLKATGGISTHNNLNGLNEGDYIHLTQAEKTKFDSIASGAQVNVLETLSSNGGTVNIGSNTGKNINLEVVQSTESQLGGGKIVNQETIEDSTSTNDTDIVTSKKFWLGWSKGLTLNSFFLAVRNTVLTGFNSAITWARVTTSSTVEIAISLLQKQSNYLQSTRFISGTGVTINSGDNTKFDIQVIGEIVDPITFTPTSINVNLTAQTATYIGTQVESYIWINSLGAVEQSLNPPLPTDYDNIVGFWVLVHSNLTNINLINSFPYYSDGTAIKVAQILSFIGFSKFPNTNIATAGTTGTRIEHTGGFAIKLGLGNTTKRPVVSLIGAVDPSDMEMRHRNGVFSTGVQNIDVTNYNPTGSTVSALSNNKFSVHKIWKFSSGLIRIQYGQKQYDNYNEAASGIAADSFVDEGNAFRNGLHIGWLIFKKGTSWGTGGTGTDGQDYKFVDVKSNGSTGGLTPTLQATYDVSTQPQITTSVSRGAFQIKGGTGVDTDNIWEGKNNSGAITSYIKADGTSSFTGSYTPQYETITSASLESLDVDGVVTYLNAKTPVIVVPPNGLLKVLVTDSEQVFEVKLNNRSFGVGQPSITSSDVVLKKDINYDKLFPTQYLYQATGTGFATVGTNVLIFQGTQTDVLPFGGGFSYRKITSAATSGTTIYAREGSFGRILQNAGYYYEARIRINDASLISDARAFHGLHTVNGFANTEISANINPMFGFSYDGTDTNWQIMRQNTISGGVSKTNLGSNFPKNQVNEYLIKYMRMPNSSDTFYEILNFSNSIVAKGKLTNNPATLTIVNHRNTNASSIACAFEIQRILLRTHD